MNYRHAFHAGSFADVLKHAVLARILVYLHAKPGAFRVIDTHAGAGLYDLVGPEATRSPEWRDGIHRLLTAPVTTSVRRLLAPYLDAVARLNNGSQLTCYPGSPAIARAYLRPQDRLIACELEPNAAVALARNLAGDRRAKAISIDGWTALSAYVPPPERRGLVLIDPSFEQKDEFEKLADGFAEAYAKWPTGSYLIWYPVKSRRASDTLARLVAGAAATSKPAGKCLRLEFSVAPQTAGGPLASTGLLIVNPPWTLAGELKTILPELEKPLGQGGAGRFRLETPKP